MLMEGNKFFLLLMSWEQLQGEMCLVASLFGE